MKFSRLILSGFIFISVQAFAQNTTLMDSVNAYGSLRTLISATSKSIEMQNNSSRVGLFLQRHTFGSFKAEGHLELGVNLLKNNTSIRMDAATADNPSVFLQEVAKPVTTRLGFIGLSSEKWGTIRIGKQWGVYYDVSQYTDMFNVFGGMASGTYNAGTDGGGEGTGRAESSVIYHKTVKNFTLGLQAQFPGTTYNFGSSLLYNSPNGITVGAAYNYYQLPAALQLAIANSKATANSVVILLRYATKKTNVAITYAYNESEDQYTSDSTIVGFTGNGLEIYAHQYVLDNLQIIAGLNYLVPAGTFASVPEDYKVLTIPFGFSWNAFPGLDVYGEFQPNLGVNIKGAKGTTISTIGINYDFSFGRGILKL